MGSYLKPTLWNTTVVFNGGHPVTEKILKDEFSSTFDKKHINQKNFFESIKKMKEQITAAKGPDSRMMILINSHGAKQNKNKNELTHSIAVGASQGKIDYDQLSTSRIESLDALKEVVTLAKEKKVPLAIVDLSCHSGALLNLADSNTCIITATNEHLYSYTNFGYSFTKKMKPGKSLEDVFLESRKEDFMPSLPQISSPSGQNLFAMGKGGLNSFLMYTKVEKDVHQLTELISTEASACINCDSSNQRQTEALEKLRWLIDEAQLSHIDTTALENLLKKYQALQKDFTKTLEMWGASKLDTTESFIMTYEKKNKKTINKTIPYTWRLILSGSWTENSEYYRKLANLTKEVSEKNEYNARSVMMRKLAKRQTELLKEYPNLKDFKKNTETLITKTTDTLNLAQEIAKEERKIYSALYEAFNKKDPTPNACQKFKL